MASVVRPILPKSARPNPTGCVRLTNWDAVLLGTNVKTGTSVVFIDQPLTKQKS
jgi:hypothetical protein